MPGLVLGVRLVLAAVFAVAGTAKLLDAAGSRGALEGFGVPRRAARLASRVLPVAELAIAAGLLVPASAWWSALAAAGLLAVFGAGPATEPFRTLRRFEEVRTAALRGSLAYIPVPAQPGCDLDAGLDRLAGWRWVTVIFVSGSPQ